MWRKSTVINSLRCITLTHDYQQLQASKLRVILCSDILNLFFWRFWIDAKRCSCFTLYLHLHCIVRNSHRRCCVKKGVLKNVVKFTRQHLCQSLFFDKLKMRLWQRCFPVNFTKFLRTHFLQNTSRWLLLCSQEFY